ncbi:MAG: hypothetical protein R2804_19365 [Cyclobacteriaceae bacterium]
MRTTINWQSLFLLWLPGVGLALLSSYYVLTRLHKVIYWESTTGTTKLARVFRLSAGMWATRA